MPKSDRTPDEFPSEELLLAAIERAETHQRGDKPGALLATIKEHLGLARGGWATRQLRPKLDALHDAGLMEHSRRHSLNLLGLTSSGRARLEAVRHAGKLGDLPESPQHRKWREGRIVAGERISEFREDLRQVLDEAIGMLDHDGQIPSDTWFEVSERLKHVCWHVGSATHCLHEWPEPHDSHADIDEQGPNGRRNTRMWDKH